MEHSPKTFVGAMSLVNKDLPGESVIGGIPAIVIKRLEHIDGNV